MVERALFSKTQSLSFGLVELELELELELDKTDFPAANVRMWEKIRGQK